MKVVQLNVTDVGSTGKIMGGIRKNAIAAGHGCISFSLKPRCSARSTQHQESHFYFSSFVEYAMHYFLSELTGTELLGSFLGTVGLIRKIKRFSPDIIHLHNIHGRYVNIPLLFRYIKKAKCRVIWTLHDCWPFTGHCPHFIFEKCEKWKEGCYNCPRYKSYPDTIFDDSKRMYKLKKKWFTGVRDMTIVTPSQWLADLVKQSFLKEYPVKVINNGIDLTVFKPTESDFRVKYNCENQFIVLGVAFGWGEKKGLDVFVELSKRLDERFQIVLVGTNDDVGKLLPDNIISIHRTHNQTELAETYSAADLFVNPTREETYPTVNMESLACGTPVLTFNTGGSPEIIDETCGSVTNKNNVESICEEIIRIYKDKPYSKEACLNRAKSFDMNERFKEYVDLYEQ